MFYVFYGALRRLGRGFHVEVVKLSKLKGVSSDRGPAILRETHVEVGPEGLAIQHAGDEVTLGADRKAALGDMKTTL